MINYTRLEKLSEGSFERVYKARDTKNDKLVMIKELRIDLDNDGIPAKIIREVSLLKELKHPNIIDLQDVDIELPHLFLVFEFVPMNLSEYIRSLDDKPMPSETVKSLLYQILLAVLFCHCRRVLLQDLRPENLLIDPGTGILKIGDFSLGRTMSSSIIQFPPEVETLWYRAPEILLGAQNYSFSVDLWAVGCIFAELVKLKPLFTGDSEIDQLFCMFYILTTPDEETWPGITSIPNFLLTFPKWTKNILKTIIKDLDIEGFNLLEGLLKYNPNARLGATDAIKHPYFDDLDKSKFPAKPYDP